MSEPDGGAAPATGSPPDTGGTSPGQGDDSSRLDRLEAEIDALVKTVARILPGSHADAQQRTEDRLDRPSSVQQQVREELERARQEEAAAADAARRQSEQQQMAEELARLREAPPAAPVPKRTKLLGWADLWAAPGC